MARPSPEVRFGDLAFVVEALAADVAAEARNALARGRPFTIAIPGGSVARNCFPRLSTLNLDWSMVEFFWADERAVPPTSPDSNYAVARSLWLEPAGVPAESIHRIPGEAAELDRAAQAYADELSRVTGTPPRLDYVLLGVGPDGHVASLFPGHPTPSGEHSVLVVENAPSPPPRRLSLSFPVLTNARRVMIVAVGEEKAVAIREAVEHADSSLPVARVARNALRCAFLLDRAAAGRG
jgi:6-phosphogluconolactonase